LILSNYNYFFIFLSFFFIYQIWNSNF